MFDQTLFATVFACLATPCCVRQTRCWTKRVNRLAGALHANCVWIWTNSQVHGIFEILVLLTTEEK